MIPKVSVLMTVFNGEQYLGECIDSVLNQTFKDFEFLIIDDCSTDSSRKIIRSYKDKRIRYTENHKNISQVRSLNIGLEQARGKYIARLDQDDLMIGNRLERQSVFLDNRPDIAVAGTWGEVIDNSGRVFTKCHLPVRYEEIVANALSLGYFLMHPSVIFRKDAVLDEGKYNETLPFAEDYDLWTRLLLKRYKFVNIPEFLIKFRFHKESSSRQFSAEQLKNARVSLSNFIKTIDGIYNDIDLDRLCSFLINCSLMKSEYWTKEKDGSCLDRVADLLDTLLKKTTSYFNFTKSEAHSMKKSFCNRMLNFAYQDPKNSKSLPLYLFCLRNYSILYSKPKLYLHPIKSIL